MQLGVNELTNS
uniref:Uncharacterized protein n=1 Tax=Arundo donax TaxID=35708 RepID=A0A0A8YFE5_ARUDO